MASGTNNGMLAINEKKTSSVELYYPVRYYLLVHYSETDFQSIVIHLQTLINLRSLVHNPTASLTHRRDVLLRYFKALCSAASILPFSPQPNHINAVLFTWFDAFKNDIHCSHPSLDLEKASVMFNFGAVCSQISLLSDRSTTDGQKQAAYSFALAAGAFAFLRDRLAPNAARGGSLTVDLSIGCAWALERLMLGQARECLYDHTIAKGSSHGVCAKMCRQVGGYYKQAFDGMNAGSLSQYFDKMWMTQIQLKAAIFEAESCFRHCLELHEKQKIGEEIARLQIGITALSGVKNISTIREAPTQFLAAVDNLNFNLNKNLHKAIEENYSVYQQIVPCLSSLPTLPAVDLPSITIDKVLDACKEDAFTSIVLNASVPEHSGRVVEKMIGLLAKKVQVGSELAQVRLEKMHLPESIVHLEEIATLPEELKAQVELVQISGGAAGLADNLQKLVSSRRVNQELLVQTEEILQKELQQGSTNLRDTVTNIRVNLQQAADSELEILHSLRERSPLMSIIDRYAIAAVLHPLLKPNVCFDANEAALVGNLILNLIQLYVVMVQCGDMLKEINQMITKLQNYDALEEHMKGAEYHQGIIDKEMEKLNEINVGISENFKAQHRLLEKIEAQKQNLSALFNLESTKQRIVMIEAALAKYHEIQKSINEGVELNATLQTAINNLTG